MRFGGNYMFGEILEMIMLIMFGLSWPLNLIKCYRARTAKGTSILFYCAIGIGYISGIVRKFYINDINFVLIFYFVNLIMILGCIAIYFRNLHLDKIASNN